MNKIKLTREQAEEIELQKKELKREDIVTRRILTIPTTTKRRSVFHSIETKRHRVFHSIELEKLIPALYNGYEVEDRKDVDYVE